MDNKLSRRERRLAWKQEKKERRESLEAHYRNAPWYIRIPRLYLLRPLITLAIIAAVGFAGYQIIPNIALNTIDANKNAPVDHEKIEALAPMDTEGAKRIDAIGQVDKDDTWTICVYLIASDLEDRGEDDLSYAVKMQIAEAKAQLEQESAATSRSRFNKFSEELKTNGLDIPEYLYYPNKPVTSDGKAESSGTAVATAEGSASKDIGEMTAEEWSDNITIVIQTGGATRWSNSMVNPNRTQRFEYKNGVLKKVYDKPIQRATDPKTLTKFMKFCRKNYPADHNMLVLWNHGGASFGYGKDSIYGGLMSLKDIRKALEGAYEPDMEDPAFDVIGFDACLMSSLEVTHTLSGFASYYAVSEESEPGDGWYYTPFLKAMTDDPTMNPAQVARSVADSYMDFYMTQNVNMGWLLSNVVQFSVLDAEKSDELYDAWCDLTKKQLIDATKDNSVLAEIGRCSRKSTHLVSSVYNLYNTIDLGNYVDHMTDTYPEESSRIKELIKESVLYHRENGSLSDCQGISVYMPGSVDDFSGLSMCLQYIYDVCDDPATRALYYYKIAGCLNEDMQTYLATITDGKIETLDQKPFNRFASADVITTDTGFEIPVGEKLQKMLQSYDLELALVDTDNGTIKNLGRDELLRLDGEGNLDCEFDGTWICLDGVPLATEVVSSTESCVEYRSHVLYNGENAYLSFAWDRDTETFTIDGIRGVSPLAGGVLNNNFNPDPFNFLVNTRMNTELKEGDSIIPFYEVTYYGTKDVAAESSDEKGDAIRIKKNSGIKLEPLADGNYLCSAVISDYRGDVYYSQVVGNKVIRGKVADRKIETGFFGRDY